MLEPTTGGKKDIGTTGPILFTEYSDPTDTTWAIADWATSSSAAA